MAISSSACNQDANKNAEERIIKKDSAQIDNSSTTGAIGNNNNNNNNVNDHVRDMVNQYLAIKNALIADNGKAAAVAGNAFVESINRIDKTSLNADKKKVWESVADDAEEMAEHIGKNADRIAHQREHFDMLSKDMYDMVKAFGAGYKLYQDFCPMYNNNKGANWLSETKEIKNPYLGKKMPTCGSIKEEIK